MNNIDDVEAIERLRRAGCTPLEIERLRRLRRNYTERSARRGHRCSALLHWLMLLLQESFSVTAPWWWWWL